MILRHVLLLLGIIASVHAMADENEAGFGSVKKIDLTESGPARSNHVMVMLNLKKVKPGSLAQVVFYQFSKRARIDFEGDGLPHGEYVLAVAPKCSSTRDKTWTELHRFKTTSAHVQNEKSLPNASLYDS